MNYFDTSAASQFSDWLRFAVILLAAGVPIAGLMIWMVIYQTKAAKRKRRLRKHRRLNPTLAQTGGLPPLRPPGEPPRGV